MPVHLNWKQKLNSHVQRTRMNMPHRLPGSTRPPALVGRVTTAAIRTVQLATEVGTREIQVMTFAEFIHQMDEMVLHENVNAAEVTQFTTLAGGAGYAPGTAGFQIELFYFGAPNGACYIIRNKNRNGLKRIEVSPPPAGPRITVFSSNF